MTASLSLDEVLAEREQEAAAARDALAKAEADLRTAKGALADEPSEYRADLAEQALRARSRAALLVEAHTRRVDEARTALEAATSEATLSALCDAENRSSPDHLLRSLRPSIDRLVELEREVGKVIEDGALTQLRAQHDAAREAVGLATKAGTVPRWRPARIEIVRALVAIEIDAARRRQGRHDAERAEDWIASRRPTSVAGPGADALREASLILQRGAT